MRAPVRVLVADDHQLVRDGIALIFDADSGFEVVATCIDGEQAVRMAGQVDLAVLDVSMPGMGGLAATREILAAAPATTVLLMSIHQSEPYLFEALRVGASGYVHKSIGARDLLDAARAALRGEPVLFTGAERTLLRQYLRLRDRPEEERTLTPRETEVLTLIADGLSGREIASRLHISLKTVDRHRGSVLAKLGFRDRVALTRYAIRVGLIDP